MGPGIRLEIEGQLARIRFDRPSRRNAIDSAMFMAIPGLLAQASASPKVKVIVLESAVPGIFSAGADIDELMANKDDPSARAALQEAIGAAQKRLVAEAKPVIAFIEGACVGAACGLALACDFRIATPEARFGITPARLGLLYPLHDVALLHALVGPGQARRLLLTGMLIGAREAQAIGLVEEVAIDPGPVIDALCANSQRAMVGLKGLVARACCGQRDDDAQSRAAFDAAFLDADFQERAAQFLARRQASGN